jgi:type II secretory pathway pseudopilin PulG
MRTDRRPARRLAAEGGFTLIELLVTMTLAIIVLGAALTVAEGFTAGAATNDRLTDAAQEARSRTDRIVRTLRNSSAAGAYDNPVVLLRNGGNDLVVSTTDWPGDGLRTGNPHAVRYCLDTSGTGTLWYDELYNPQPDNKTPEPNCPSRQSGWRHQTVIAQGLANDDARPLFRLDTADPAAARNIAISIVVSAGGTRTARIDTSVGLRNGG